MLKPAANARLTIDAYYAAFNAMQPQAMLECLTDDVEHRVNEGGVRLGREKFAEFCADMGTSFREELRELVVFVSEDGTRAAAEFVVHGEYVTTVDGLPQARGQRYVLPAGSFFELRAGKISRVTTFYNLNDWIAQVSQ